MLEKEFESKVKSEAQEFRDKKIKEIMEKENPTKEEISFIESWAEMFKKEDGIPHGGVKNVRRKS